MKNTKRRFTLFSFYDHTGIESYLEKQAEKGWMLDKISALGWHFHRIEPKKMHFSVVYFSKASAFDPEPSQQQLEYQDFCEHIGWQLATSNAQMQIFYNESPNPTPIDTDAVLEVSAIHKSIKKSFLPTYCLLAFTGILQIALFIHRFLYDPVGILSSNANLFTGLCWIFMLIMLLIEVGGYCSWYKRAKTAAELDGSFIETKGHYSFQVAVLGFMLLALTFLLISYGGNKMILSGFIMVTFVLGVTAIILGISKLMKKWKVSAKLNRNITILLTIILSFGFCTILIITVVSRITLFMLEKPPADTYEFKGHTYKIYNDELPLTIEDLIETDYDGYSYQVYSNQKSILAEYQKAVQRPRLDNQEQPELSYSISTIKLPFLYNLCKTALLEKFAHTYDVPEWESCVSIDATPWGAKEAYQLILGNEPKPRFLLCYDERIVEINFYSDWDLTEEQMKTIGTTLGT